MNFIQILTPTINKLILFVKLFVVIHLLNYVLISLVSGFWDGVLSFGFPISFYGISCGLGPNDCNLGFNALRFLFDILFWYGVTVVIKRNESAS